MIEYFSDIESGATPRLNEEIPDILWRGIAALIMSEISKQSFAQDFPEACPDGGSTCGTDLESMVALLKCEIPQIEWPITNSDKPDKLVILDLIQFCYKHISNADQGHYHSYYKHHHFNFERDEGKFRYSKAINLLFSRNGVIYELKESGEIIRILNPILNTVFQKDTIVTNDQSLDNLLKTSLKKFSNPDLNVRKEGLEKLWDAWERIKTIEPGRDKKESTKLILDAAAMEQHFREVLEKDATELTRIGNNFHIRHSETDRIEINDSEHIDYLFFRMYNIINLLLNKKIT